MGGQLDELLASLAAQAAYSLLTVDFFARGLHRRSAVARLPLRQLGFLVINRYCNNKSVYTTTSHSLSQRHFKHLRFDSVSCSCRPIL